MIWIEFRCSRRSRDDAVRCWSHVNAGPMEIACDDTASVLQMLKLLARAARESGWRRFRIEGWVCPACKDHPVIDNAPGRGDR